MMSADIEYGCEYLGNSGRLVVCFLPCCIYAAEFLLRVPFVCTACGCSRMAKTRAPPGVFSGLCAGAEQNQLFQFVTEIVCQIRIFALIKPAQMDEHSYEQVLHPGKLQRTLV